MKKYLLLFIIGVLVLTGCGKYDKNDAMKDFSKMVSDTDSYSLKGNLEILSNEETFKYNVEVAFKEGDYYKVNLKNNSNDHEQIILKNDDGVYVITPSLNKSFKFQSEWPNNSSQAYILSTLLHDLENDKEKNFTEKDDTYIFTTSVNYPNNRNLVKEKITLDKKMNLKQVEVVDSDNTTIIKFKVTAFDKKANFKKSYFALDNNVKSEMKEENTSETNEATEDSNAVDENTQSSDNQNENATEESETNTEESSSLVDDVIYPMYLPENTKFESEEKVSTEGSQRVILNFEGEKPFTLIQETSAVSDEFEIIPVYGELTFLDSSFGVLTSTSLNWTNNNKEYYLIGENLSEEELVQIASSTSSVALNK